MDFALIHEDEFWAIAANKPNKHPFRACTTAFYKANIDEGIHNLKQTDRLEPITLNQVK